MKAKFNCIEGFKKEDFKVLDSKGNELEITKFEYNKDSGYIVLFKDK